MKSFILANVFSRQITYKVARSSPFQQHAFPFNALKTTYSTHSSWEARGRRHFTGIHIKKLTSPRSQQMSQQSTQFQGTTVPELELWLQQHGINTSLYGVGASKPLELLLEEVAVGETILATSVSSSSFSSSPSPGGAQRTVSIVNVGIRNSRGQTLYEATQILPTGTARPRNLPLSEKMLPSETWREAATRGIDEELGSILQAKAEVLLDESTYIMTEEVKESQSYPGLQTNVRKKEKITKKNFEQCFDFNQ
jgi:hypothetical protein